MDESLKEAEKIMLSKEEPEIDLSESCNEPYGLVKVYEELKRVL